MSSSPRRLPASWAAATFDDLFSNVTSSQLKLAQRDYRQSGRFAVIDQGRDLIGGYSDDESLVHPSALPVVVFGDHTRCVKFSDRPFIQGADGVKILAPKNGVNPKYSYWALRAADLPSRGYARHFDLVRKLSFALAPLPEQSRIVDAIETQLTRLDAAVAALERVRANLKRYRASVLKAAVEGRLVPTEAELARQKGRKFEPAVVLLRRILAERRRLWEEAPKDAKRRTKYDDPVAPDMTALPELPEGWCWASIEQLTVLVTDGDHNPPNRVPDGVPHLTAKSVKRWQLSTDGCSYVSQAGYEKTRARYQPIEGDLIVTCVGTVGETAIVPGGMVFSADRNLAGCRFVVAHHAKIAQLALSSPEWRQRLASASGSTAQPHLYLRDIRSLPIPLMPDAEAYRIVSEVERRMSIADELDQTFGVTQTRAARLRQSILKWAFEGRLVDPNPNDEPASVLLGRIRAERTVATANDQTKGRRNGRKKKAA